MKQHRCEGGLFQLKKFAATICDNRAPFCWQCIANAIYLDEVGPCTTRAMYRPKDETDSDGKVRQICALSSFDYQAVEQGGGVCKECVAATKARTKRRESVYQGIIL